MRSVMTSGSPREAVLCGAVRCIVTSGSLRKDSGSLSRSVLFTAAAELVAETEVSSSDAAPASAAGAGVAEDDTPTPSPAEEEPAVTRRAGGRRSSPGQQRAPAAEQEGEAGRRTARPLAELPVNTPRYATYLPHFTSSRYFTKLRVFRMAR